MASKRNITFVNNYWYHICNRGIDGRSLFLSSKEYQRFLSILEYYQYMHVPMRYSHLTTVSVQAQTHIWTQLRKQSKQVTIAAYCLMPNHFHLLIRQNASNAISKYMSDIANSYSKYFNTKRKRIGPLFQGVFRAVPIESDEQLLHVSRYIHINPYVASLISLDDTFIYPWSSLFTYDTNIISSIVDKTCITDVISVKKYRQFVLDQMDYAKSRKQMESVFLEQFE